MSTSTPLGFPDVLFESKAISEAFAGQYISPALIRSDA